MHLAPRPPSLGIDLCDPIASHPLNEGRAFWGLALPETAGGPKFYDLCGSTAGSLSGDASWSATSAGPSIKFGGSGEVQRAGDRTAVGSVGSRRLVVGITCRFPSGAGDRGLISKVASNDQFFDGWGIFLSSGAFALYLNGDNFNDQYTGTAAPSPGVFHRVLFDFGYGGPIRFWVDGKTNLITSNTDAGGSESGHPLRIGYHPYAPITNWLGEIADVSIWSGNGLALSNPAAFAALDYAESRAGYPDSLNRVRPSVAAFMGTAAPTFRPYYLPGSPVIGSGVY